MSSNSNKLTNDELRVITRMLDRGDYVVHSSGGGYYWANTDVRGLLIEPVDSDDLYIIQKLAREGRGGVIFERKTFNYEVYKNG